MSNADLPVPGEQRNGEFVCDQNPHPAEIPCSRCQPMSQPPRRYVGLRNLWEKPFTVPERGVEEFVRELVASMPLIQRRAPMTDELAEAIQQLRYLVACRCDPAYTDRRLHEPNSIHEYAEDVDTVVNELDRLKGVEQAAGLLLDACDAREEAGMTTGADKVREFLRDVRRTP